MGIDEFSNNNNKTPRLLDSGAKFTAHPPQDNVQTLQGHTMMQKIQPNKATMQSSAEAKLKKSPDGSTTRKGSHGGHVTPILKNHAMILLGRLCNNGCMCSLTKQKACKHHKGKLLFDRIHDENGLWCMESANEINNKLNSTRKQPVQSACQTTQMKDAVHISQAALFSPTKPTLLLVV